MSLSDADIRAKIERNVIPEPNSGCWLWTAFVPEATGYGRVRTKSTGACEGAHRASYRAYKGPIPRGLLVCHKCDVRSCVNPDHLFLGTALDNMRDAARKGRMNWKPNEKRNLPTGERHHAARLSAEIVRIIRSSKESGAEISRRFDVTPVTISRIRRHIIWRAVA